MNEDTSFNKRLLLAFLLSGAVFLLALPWITPKPAKKQVAAPKQRQQQLATQPGAASAPQTAAKATPLPVTPPATANIQDSAQKAITVETPTFRVVFTNRGGSVLSWVLRDYKDAAGRPLDLVSQKFGNTFGRPLDLHLSDGNLQEQVNNALYRVTVTPGADGAQTVLLQWAQGGSAVEKRIVFGKGYIVKVHAAVTRNGEGVPASLFWPGDFGDRASPNNYEKEQVVEAAGQDVNTTLGAKTQGGKITTQEFNFVGIEDTYFASIFLPAHGGAFSLTIQKNWFIPNAANPVPNDPSNKGKKSVPTAGVAVGGGSTVDFHLFVGPKRLDLLRSIDPQMGKLVDFGWFGFVAEPIFLWMHWTYIHWIHNYGWAIVFLTFVITIAIFPFRLKAQRSQVRMAELQPKVQPINDKIKRLPMRDPRRQQLQAEIMKVYQDEGVNPLGGCLPMLLPWPILFGFWKVLDNAIELRQAPWIGYLHDLSARDPYYILPILMVIIQFWTMQLMPMPPGQDAMQMKMMRYIMPLAMAYIFFFLPAGVNLYYLTSTALGAAQQILLNKKLAPMPAVAKAARKR